MITLSLICFFFFFNDTATTEIYTLSLHDALPILGNTTVTARDRVAEIALNRGGTVKVCATSGLHLTTDRKSTRLNSSHLGISYAVFCLKKKKNLRRVPAISLAYRIYRAVQH